MTKVAVVGLGGMGSRIAIKLLDAGHELVVWNRSPNKTKPLVDRGAVAADSPALAAGRSEAVLTMVADPAALQDVVEGPTGIAAGIGPPTTLIEMSTVGPAAIRRVEAALPEEVGFLDAPVLGSLSEVESGSLKIFVGGPEDLVARWKPLLSELGTPLRVGPLGSGAAAKLVANTTLFGTLGVLGEALALANRLGLASNVAFEVLAATPLGAQSARRQEAIEADAYPLRFSLSLARKDLNLIMEAARHHEADLRLSEAARTWFADADEAGWGERDYSAILARIRGS